LALKCGLAGPIDHCIGSTDPVIGLLDRWIIGPLDHCTFSRPPLAAADLLSPAVLADKGAVS
jgi:hypothetical protein